MWHLSIRADMLLLIVLCVAVTVLYVDSPPPSPMPPAQANTSASLTAGHPTSSPPDASAENGDETPAEYIDPAAPLIDAQEDLKKVLRVVFPRRRCGPPLSRANGPQLGVHPTLTSNDTNATVAVNDTLSRVVNQTSSPAVVVDDHVATAKGLPCSNESDDTFYDRLGHDLDTFLTGLLNNTDAFVTHEAYIRKRRFFVDRLVHLRRAAVMDETRTLCMQYVRADERLEDIIYRVPCLPRRIPTLRTIAAHEFGLWATFEHVRPPTSADASWLPGVEKPSLEMLKSFRPSLRVAVEMSGHMRTFRKCFRSTVKRVLEPNQALLFVSTYPDIGDKRFGVRVQDRDDAVDFAEVAGMYAPYLAGLYVADVPTVRSKLQRVFPSLFSLTQWSWMIYQLFMMEVVHNITVAHVGTPGSWEPFPAKHGGVFRSASYGMNETGIGQGWEGFDVIIRIRPDLYILGTVFVIPVNETAQHQRGAAFAMMCGGNVYIDVFNETQLLRAPHHPVEEWFVDPLSDHSAVGFTPVMSQFLRLYEEARRLAPKQQEKVIFFHGNTAERIWGQYVERHNMQVLRTFGWHVMLRNEKKWLNTSTVVAKTVRRRELMKKIFGVTKPETVGCPLPSRKMRTLPPKTRSPKAKFPRRNRGTPAPKK